MRRWSFAAAAAAVLVLVYAAAGYWLAPRVLMDRLVGEAARRGFELRAQDVRTDPFRLSVELREVRLSTAGNRTLAAAQRVGADLSWASLWKRSWIVESAVVEQPRAEVTRGPKGELDWALLFHQGDDVSGGGPGAAFALRRIGVTDGSLTFVDRSRGAPPVEARLEALAFEMTGLSTGGDGSGNYTLSARLADGGRLASKGTVSLGPLAARGQLDLASVPLAKVWRWATPGTQGAQAAEAAEPAQGQLHGSAGFAYDSGQLVLQNVGVRAADVAYVYKGASFEVTEVALQVPRLPLPPREQVEVSATANAKPGGRISAQGALDFQPFGADLKLEVASLPLALAQPWIAELARLKVASGALSGQGRLRVGGAPSQSSAAAGRASRATYEGSVTVGDLRIDEADSGERFLGWRSVEAKAATIAFAPYRVQIGEIVAQAPQARVIVEANRRFNLARVLKREEKRPEGGERFEAELQRLRIENGSLEFADRSLETPFATTIHRLSGVVSGIALGQDRPARVSLAGRVGKYGEARIRGTVDIDSPRSLTDLVVSFRNLELPDFTPYIVKFAGYRVASGRLSAELRYQVRQGRLAGENQVVIEQLQLGERVKRAGALGDLPLELAVALLADSQGRINLAIPVRGDLSDPHFDFGGLIARAIGNALGKVASAPFRMLGALAGGGRGEGLGEVRFEPGSVELAPPEQEKIAQVAKALADRPQLAVAVRGSYDPETDAAALRERLLRRELARRAGYTVKGVEDPGPLDLEDPKIRRAAEALFLRRGGSRLELLQLRRDEQGYGKALFEQLAARSTIDPGAPEALARARAETVRAALLAQGVPPARVRLDEPARAEAAKEGVPTVLALSAAGTATAQTQGGSAAGGTSRENALPLPVH